LEEKKGTKEMNREFKVDIESGQCPQCGDDGEELFYYEGTGKYYCDCCWDDHEEKWNPLRKAQNG
jgi:hypothetical protein